MRGKLFADVLRVADGIDWKGVVIELAESTPEVVAKVIAGYTERYAWMNDARQTCSQGKVAAIRLVREQTGSGLLEAKQWVEGDTECCKLGGWEFVPMPDSNSLK